MGARLWQVAYVSRSGRPFADADLDALESHARRRNAAAGVTGLLLFDGTGFVQALEGGEAAVRGTLARIEADPRHQELMVVADEPTLARQFGGWAMKVHRPADLPPDAALALVEQDLAGLLDPHLRAIFANFAGLGRRRPPVPEGKAGLEERARRLHLKLLVERAHEGLGGAGTLRRLADGADQLDPRARERLGLARPEDTP